ncbi:MAG: nitroreductase family protein [Candidatus Thalassarchaeum betae]|uniref:Nitroreductase family protein n=1 Tax=Candidatus Thalassarchaeum betae TaxID=2599289 RepID=A0A2V3HQN0_9ARCH|nr:MAG: nitroreductase family protein [Candidatus Thalassoarchaea betae]PXF26421.1 MAG: nitroreductase family protein [Euryarchaeota archaeon]HIC49946.1 nitroreductase family protein [Candidatus Poseidoniales archaeon]HIM13374.1 nitroreductase family protein [Candidatus Poseidoniales archaeon]HIM92376.1 nitroreductase family protein [Candidatus Poseidoniales archaeon]
MGEGDDEPGFIELAFEELSSEDMLERAREFHTQMSQRRTTRHFSAREVPRELIELAVRTAGTAPSGAHLQPWTFVAVSNPELKVRIREAAEAEEKKFYEGRMPEAWEEVLTPLGTDYVKEHITDAPWIVVLFRHSQRERAGGEMSPTYYAQESCGIAAGLFIAAVHNMGLTTLTHTPSPMGFLRDILGRPDHEHAMLLMPVGYPAEDARVPDLKRKGLDEVSEFFE